MKDDFVFLRNDHNLRNQVVDSDLTAKSDDAALGRLLTSVDLSLRFHLNLSQNPLTDGLVKVFTFIVVCVEKGID